MGLPLYVHTESRSRSGASVHVVEVRESRATPEVRSSRLGDIVEVIRLLLLSKRRPGEEVEPPRRLRLQAPDILGGATSAFSSLLRRLDPYPVFLSGPPSPIRHSSLTMTFFEAFWGLMDPWLFMWEAVKRLPPTLLRLVKERQWRVLLSWSKFQSAWFGTFWKWAGPGVRETGEAKVVPLLEGRVHRGQILDDPVIVAAVNGTDAGIGGTCLEIGPGSGMWVSLFSDRYLDPPAKSTATSPTTPSGGRTNGIGHDNPFEDALRRRRENEARPRGSSRRRVTRVYGVEPNTDIHGELRQRVRDAGLEGVYEVVPVGIEDLERSGKVQKGSVDCIVTVLCLCTIPDPKYNIRELYDYLKPGGRWYVYEHVRCSNNWGMILYQG